jgi:hypothetical protein
MKPINFLEKRIMRSLLLSAMLCGFVFASFVGAANAATSTTMPKMIKKPAPSVFVVAEPSPTAAPVFVMATKPNAVLAVNASGDGPLRRLVDRFVARRQVIRSAVRQQAQAVRAQRLVSGIRTQQLAVAQHVVAAPVVFQQQHQFQHVVPVVQHQVVAVKQPVVVQRVQQVHVVQPQVQVVKQQVCNVVQRVQVVKQQQVQCVVAVQQQQGVCH